jgi:hypothetical protein
MNCLCGSEQQWRDFKELFNERFLEIKQNVCYELPLKYHKALLLLLLLPMVSSMLILTWFVVFARQ